MTAQQASSAWSTDKLVGGSPASSDSSEELNRLWLGFMTTRVMLSIVLVMLQFVLLYADTNRSSLLLVVCTAYFVVALAMRLMAAPGRLGQVLNRRWIGTVGLDILMFAVLQLTQATPVTSINFVPLFALPILMASVLGSLLLAMGAAAAVTLLLLGQAVWLATQAPWDLAAQFMQAALTGAGCFSIAFLANQIAKRLVSQESKAARIQLVAKAQAQVNTLVIESLTDGILVINPQYTVRAANPAALALLGPASRSPGPAVNLQQIPQWHGLVKLSQETFADNQPRLSEIVIEQEGLGKRRIQVQTRVTATQAVDPERLCVMFLKDQREIEARMRKDKLASMARMSVAVAHEIRNPLAAITQANALLAEDILEPRHQQLLEIIRQNARRLEKIVDEVLNVTRLQGRKPVPSSIMSLQPAVLSVHRDWSAQNPDHHPPLLNQSCRNNEIFFESEHLRQVLVNLLDNARRYASSDESSIQIHTELDSAGRTTISVWSNGMPMDQSVEHHLFEPFFSSESRSSGLGLYICRELCEGHGAAIAYSRGVRLVSGLETEGNEFTITFRSPSQPVRQTLAPKTQSTENGKQFVTRKSADSRH